jgi:hypothetical protein
MEVKEEAVVVVLEVVVVEVKEVCHLVLACGEGGELLLHVGDGLDDALAHLLHADVPDGARRVAHLTQRSH